jgi:hypothetical protein
VIIRRPSGPATSASSAAFLWRSRTLDCVQGGLYGAEGQREHLSIGIREAHQSEKPQQDVSPLRNSRSSLTLGHHCSRWQVPKANLAPPAPAYGTTQRRKRQNHGGGDPLCDALGSWASWFRLHLQLSAERIPESASNSTIQGCKVCNPSADDGALGQRSIRASTAPVPCTVIC